MSDRENKYMVKDNTNLKTINKNKNKKYAETAEGEGEAGWKSLWKELATRNKQCKLKAGPMYEYTLPSELQGNPYRFIRNGMEYMAKYPFKGSFDDCKVFQKQVPRDTDKQGRYYTQAKHEEQCEILRGMWDSNALNRTNKYDTGVCWVSEPDQTCGRRIPMELLRPYEMRNNERAQGAVEKSKEFCQANPQCKMVRPGKYSYDCSSIAKADKRSKPTITPPANMPKDTRKDMEIFLKEWYVDNKHGNPPLTTELEGIGNRCKPPVAVPVNATIAEPLKKDFTAAKGQQRTIARDRDLPHVDLTKLNPLLPENNLIFQRYGVPHDVLSKLKRRWFYISRLPGNVKVNPDNYEDPKVLLAPYMVNLSDMDDEELPVKESKTRSLSTLSPSIPQSIVNMIMKKIAIDEKSTTNRGILAWHSLGSGKTCTAAGVIDAFWDTKRQIIFASSLDAIASNPPYKFHECAMNLFPRFLMKPFLAKTKRDTMTNIANAFAKRDVKFLSFAKLSNRVKKTEQYKREKIKSRSIAKVGGSPRRKRVSSKEPEKKTRGKPKSRSKKAVEVTPPVIALKAIRKSNTNKIRQEVVDEKKAKRVVAVRRSTRTPVKTTRASRTKPGKDDYIDLDNAVLIIDEVHNLFRPLQTQREQHEYLEKELLDLKRHPNLKIVILTATPGDNINDVVKLINIIRDVSSPPIKEPDVNNEDDMNQFKKDIRGLISFFDMSKDTTKFPVVIDDEIPIKYPMSSAQLDKYIEMYNEVKPGHKDFAKLTKDNQANKYWQSARKYANTLYNFDKGMVLSDFSAKLPGLLENIKKDYYEKHYVYSAFFENRGYGGHGILAIAKELEKLGYTKLTVSEAKRLNKAGELPKKNSRYILATSKEIGEEGSSEAGKNLHEMIKIFNNEANKDGGIVQVLLASQGFNEGIDLKGVRHIHFFEPLITMASDRQTIGRAARYCSHSDLDKDNGEWTVKVHRYMSDMPVDNVKQNDTMDEDLSRLNEQILQARQKLEELAGIKADAKGKKQTDPTKEDTKAIKNALSDLKKQLTAVSKQSKAVKKKNKGIVENIEERIFKESRDRMKELMIIYQAMKEAAVDCHVLSKFHSATGTKVTCSN
jgi:hypothetical protein